MRGRFGDRIDRDAAARLHELTEGWPLGLQLALSVMAPAAAERDAAAAATCTAARCASSSSTICWATSSPTDLDFLTRISVVDHLHPELCAR